MEHEELDARDLEARQGICATLAAYARLADENRPEAQVELFTEDCGVSYAAPISAESIWKAPPAKMPSRP